MRYYPFVKNWKRIKKHLSDIELNKILVIDFNRYTFGRWKQKFKSGQFPREFESCDWDIGHKGRQPEYWKYVKHGACHWVVNFNLELAKLVEPKRNWRIVTSQEHSTVWDGENTLFDMNFCALGIDPKEAFEIASKENKCLPIGKRLMVYYAEHYSTEINKK